MALWLVCESYGIEGMVGVEVGLGMEEERWWALGQQRRIVDK